MWFGEFGMYVGVVWCGEIVVFVVWGGEKRVC